MEEFVVNLSPEEARVQEAIEGLLDSEGFELVKIKLKRAQTKSLLALYVDTKGRENGIVMENLQDISHLLSDVLDASFNDDSLIKGKYDLEVSSPGLDRPLTRYSHFMQAVGKQVKIRLRVANETGAKNLSGILLSASEQEVTIELPHKETISALYAEIADANVIFDFSEMEKNKSKKK